MDKVIIRKILKKLYRIYKIELKVSRFPAAQIWRELDIKDKTELLPLWDTNLVERDNQENIYLSNKGINYMDRVFTWYKKLAGRIVNWEMENKNKEDEAFNKVNKEIENEQVSSPAVFNVKDSQIHFGYGDNIKQNKVVSKTRNNIKDIPLWLKYIVAAVTIFAFGWGLYIYFYPNEYGIVSIHGENENIATSTTDISELLSKAIALNTVIERQDFLSKYIGDQIHGKGMVDEVSRYGSDFLVDIKVNRQTLTCSQKGSKENEKQLLLLKGKNISFVGIFTYKQIFEHGLEIDNCVLSK